MWKYAFMMAASGCGFAPTQGHATDGAPSPDAAHDARMIDARLPDAMLDAPAFTVAMCPASYDQTISGHPGSRYRYITAYETFAVQNADCNNDHPGWTHLVVVNDMPEASAIGQIDVTDFEWIGAVQAPAQTAVDQGWVRFDGGALATGWSPSGNQPDDGGDHVENGQESLAVVASTGNMHDATGLVAHPAACECDGAATPPSVVALIPPL